jgi:hypothetical protein
MAETISHRIDSLIAARRGRKTAIILTITYCLIWCFLHVDDYASTDWYRNSTICRNMTISPLISLVVRIDWSEKAAGHIGFGAVSVIEKTVLTVDEGTWSILSTLGCVLMFQSWIRISLETVFMTNLYVNNLIKNFRMRFILNLNINVVATWMHCPLKW